MMGYEIGDTVIHWTHGMGKVVAIEERILAGITQAYYVVEVGLLKLWIPAEAADQGPLRFPMESVAFQHVISILHTPGAPLSNNYTKRRFELRDRIQKRTPESLCCLIRDLTDRSRSHTLNQNDSDVLFRAEEYLLDEWVLSLDIERSKAQRELDVILRSDRTEGTLQQ
jgi:RNA polymerase-interacting CarD/CdnL/TRCF family regulator